MITFRQDLYTKVTDLVKSVTQTGTDPVDYVKTYDDHLHDLEMEFFPFIVVNVRTAEKAALGSESEIGNTYDLYMWTVHIYYLDIVENYTQGDVRRDKLLGKIVKKLEENRRLQNLQSTTADGHREYVYDSSISAVLFDYSGQEEYHSFVSELYLNVYTAKS